MSDDWCPENDGAYRMELAARERDTITSLRARLEQAERERAHWRLTALMSRREGFRAGIEAAAAALEHVANNWSCGHMPPYCDCQRDVDQWNLAADEVRALAEQKGGD